MTIQSTTIKTDQVELIERANSLFNLSKELLTSRKLQESLNYGMQALEIYEIGNFNFDISEISIHISIIHVLNCNLDEAVIFAKKSLYLAQESADYQACIIATNLLGTIARKNMNYSKAVCYILEAKKQAENHKQDNLLATIYDNLGKTSRKIGKYDESIKLNKKALEFYNKYGLEDLELYISILSNLGSCYFHIEDSLTAISYYESALTIALSSNNKNAQASIFTKIARIHQKDMQYEEAITYLTDALNIYIKYSNKKGLAITYIDLGHALLKQGLYNDSKKYLLLSLNLLFPLNLQDYIILCYKYLSELEEVVGNYKESLEYYKDFSELKNSLVTEKNTEYISKLYSKYQVDSKEKEKEIYRLKNIELVKAHKDLRSAYDKMEFMANKDPLTGLLNRRAMMERISLEKNKVKRNNTSLSIVLADIDHFKLINDNYGHDIGDEILVELSKIMTTSLRGTDAICRWGGEEFLILLPETDINNAISVSDKLRSIVQNHSFNDSLATGSVTMTLGVAKFQNDFSVKKWIQTADEAMYCGKNSGRNCVREAKS